MDTENGARGSGEWMNERRTEKSSSRVCGSDHGRGGERDKVLKTVAIAVGILMAVLPAAAAALLESMACFSINGSMGAAEMVLLAVEVFLLSGVKAGTGKGKADSRLAGGAWSRGGGPGKDRTMGGIF